MTVYGPALPQQLLPIHFKKVFIILSAIPNCCYPLIFYLQKVVGIFLSFIIQQFQKRIHKCIFRFSFYSLLYPQYFYMLNTNHSEYLTKPKKVE